MQRWFWPVLVGALGCLGLGLTVASGAAPGPMAAVDQSRLAANKDPGQWLTIGGGWSEQRFSPLSQINDKTVQRLGLAWYVDLNTYRGVEGTPVIVDGVL